MACQLQASRPRQTTPCLWALMGRGLALGGNAGRQRPRCQMLPHTSLRVLLALPVVAAVGHSSLPTDGVMGPRGQRESAQVLGSLLCCHGRNMEGCGCQLLAQPQGRETEAAPVVSQICCAGLCRNSVISLQMSDHGSCCVNNIPPRGDTSFVMKLSIRAATELDALWEGGIG